MRLTLLVAAAHDAVEEEEQAAEEDCDGGEDKNPVEVGCGFHGSFWVVFGLEGFFSGGDEAVDV